LEILVVKDVVHGWWFIKIKQFISKNFTVPSLWVELTKAP
jgi:hypothetical protein